MRGLFALIHCSAVLELLQAAAERGLTVHIAKHRMVLDQSLPLKI